MAVSQQLITAMKLSGSNSSWQAGHSLLCSANVSMLSCVARLRTNLIWLAVLEVDEVDEVDELVSIGENECGGGRKLAVKFISLEISR